MDVIIFEKEAFWKLIEEIEKWFSEKEKHPWIGEEEAMELLGIRSKTHLGDLRKSGKIRFSQPSRKVIRYDKCSILKYLEDNAIDTF
jgi:hypothetical protein